MPQFKIAEGLTTENLTAIKNLINSNLQTVIEGKTIEIHIAETNFQPIADWFNQDNSPTVNIWIPNLDPKTLNQALVMSEFQALTVQKQNGWFAMIGGNEVNATIAQVRTNFGTIFSGATLSNLTAMAQRPATRFENLSVVTNGTGKSTDMFGYIVSHQDIQMAIAL